MRTFRAMLRRFRSIRSKDTNNLELSEELQFHLEREIEENIARGVPPERARKQAMCRFGSVVQTTAECYQARGTAWADDLIQDVRFAVRSFAKEWSSTAVIVLTLAIGIGACTAIFSLVDAVLLRSLPYGNSDRLVYLFIPNPKFSLPPEIFGPTNADFFDIRRDNHSFSGMTLFEQASYDLAKSGEAYRVGAAKIDASFFTVLQVGPTTGRAFNQADQEPGHDRVAIVSDSLAQGLFGGPQGAVGKQILLDGTGYYVVGVMPRGFEYPHRSEIAYGNGHIDRTQIWIPLALTPQEISNRGGSTGYALARLKPGMSLEVAKADIGAIMSQLNLLHPPSDQGWVAHLQSFSQIALGPVRPLMFLLMASVGLVLLIACGNAANLLLARSMTRAHELGVRTALGAGRERLLRQMLTESLLLSLGAGLLGAGMASAFLHGLQRLNPGDIPRMETAALDFRVLTFLAGVSVVSTVLAGVLPSVAATRVDLTKLLTGGGLRGVQGGRRSMRNWLTVAQISFVAILLCGAGLLVRSYVKLIAVPTGFSSSTVTGNVQLSSQLIPKGRYSRVQDRAEFFHEIVDELQAVRGIRAVGLVDHLPLSNSESLSTFETQGYPNEKNQLVESRRVTPEYFSAMGISIVRGRGFTDQDTPGHPMDVIINQALARRYFGTVDAVGRHLRTSSEEPWRTIVGVIGDLRNMSVEESAAPQMYTCLWQGDTDGSPMNGAFIAANSSLPSDILVKEIRAVIRSVDPNLAFSDVHTMGDVETEAMARRRFQTALLTVFSGIAMLLAMAGVYGLFAFSVRKRTGEIGIRMALGSTRGDVLGLILREGLALGLAGLGIGLLAAVAIERLLVRFLFQVSVTDPMTFALAGLLLLGATLLACLVPSLRAAAVDPMEALRHE
jgi:predicted permease